LISVDHHRSPEVLQVVHGDGVYTVSRDRCKSSSLITIALPVQVFSEVVDRALGLPLKKAEVRAETALGYCDGEPTDLDLLVGTTDEVVEVLVPLLTRSR